jgi:hydrocephalus-inducing protein
LDLLNQEREKIVQERDKLLKKAGKKSKDLEDKWGPINEA